MKSRISPRWSSYDYTGEGIYFVTICTKNREYHFGEMVCGINGRNEMILSKVGRCCELEIKNTGIIRPHVKVYEYIVMPDHVHLLIGVGTHGNASTNTINSDDQTLDAIMDALPKTLDIKTDAINNQTMDALPCVPTQTKNLNSQNGDQSTSIQSLGSIVRNIKSRVTKFANQNNIGFERQGRYHDRIVRTQQEFEKIKYYIQKNVEKWDIDGFS